MFRRASLHAQLCLTPYDPVDCSLPGYTVHGIFQARIPEWVAISFSRGSSQPRDQTHISCVSALAGRFFTTAPLGSPPLLHISLVYITVWSFKVIKFLCSISNAEKFLLTVQLSSYKCLESLFFFLKTFKVLEDFKVLFNTFNNLKNMFLKYFKR